MADDPSVPGKESPSLESAAPAPKPKRARTPTPRASSPGWGSRLADAGLIALFLGLTFLLGVFPLNDTDFWWHLRTGDLIRQTGTWPRTDIYTFGAAGRPWIDLHWLFEVLISLGYQNFGVPGLNLAKCVVTCLAVLLLVTARRRDWPVWVMLLAWLPGLLVLSGRMYVRPETLTLLYLAGFLAILSRWRRQVWLAWLLPILQILWVNTQGLFVLGPVILGFAWVDAMLAPGAFAPERRRWWRTVLLTSLLTALACLVNPYHIHGALFPLQLVRTMGSPIFARTIGELKPLDDFIAEAGFRSVPLQFHLVTMALGGLSFLVPIVWRIAARAGGGSTDATPPRDGKKPRRKKKVAEPAAEPWRISPFRLLLYASFSLLSLRATRNSHQFAAVVGTITAWNFGEWAAAIHARRQAAGALPPGSGIVPRLATAGCLVGLMGFVATGAFFDFVGEGRTLGLGEKPLWFPHDAVRVAGSPGTPDRFVCFHNGHAALYEYAHGPERKTYADARLEVIGPELYAEYLALEQSIRHDFRSLGDAQAYANQFVVEPEVRPHLGPWRETLRRQGQPGILADLVHAANTEISATLLGDPAWRCLWFDPIAAVFVPAESPAAARPCDFAARHYRPDPSLEPKDQDGAVALAKAILNVANFLRMRGRDDVATPMVLLGLDHARRARLASPKALDGWKQQGLLETLRDPIGSPEDPIRRYKMPFDPVFDVSASRSVYLLKQALALSPEDQKSLMALSQVYFTRGMFEEAYALLERLATLEPTNQTRPITQLMQRNAIAQAARCKAEMGPEPSQAWRNLEELDRAVTALLDTGRVAAAADLLERAYPPDGRPWEITDRIASLRLALGEPERARAVWEAAAKPPRPAVVAARIAATHLIQDDFLAARKAYEEAIRLDPALFEAHYGLALLEQDAGRAKEAAAVASRAAETASSEVARQAARAVAALAKPYAEPESR